MKASDSSISSRHSVNPKLTCVIKLNLGRKYKYVMIYLTQNLMSQNNEVKCYILKFTYTLVYS